VYIVPVTFLHFIDFIVYVRDGVPPLDSDGVVGVGNG
jgi:hypothetical protein